MSTHGASTLRAGLVGCGAIAANHVAALRAQQGVEVVACVDVDLERAEAFAAQHGIARAYASVDELLAAGVDLVSVCTPHPTHEAVVVAAAAASVHVLCEKPLAVSVDAAQRMVDACREAGVTLGAIFQRRYWPAAQRIRAAIDSGEIGAPILGRVDVSLHRDSSYYSATPWRGTWETDGGGVVMTQAIHYVDLLQWYFGEVEWVMAAADTFVHGDVIEVEDTLVATLRFTTGAVAQFTASTALTPGLGLRISVTGANGATGGLLEYPEGEEAVNDIWAIPGSGGANNLGTLAYPTDVVVDRALDTINAALIPFHALQIGDFVEAVREGREPGVTGEDALRSLRIMSAMYASASSGKPERPDAQ